MTRWQSFFKDDPNLRLISESQFSSRAGNYFRNYNKQKILDLGCGIGRDSFSLAAIGMEVTAVDLAISGLLLGQQILGNRTNLPVFFSCGDAQELPFAKGTFEGVYCFGLLHEFCQSDGWKNISRIMSEIHRVLEPGGILALAVLAGDPTKGLPHVLLFQEEMLDRATRPYSVIEKRIADDIGCTGKENYRIWQALFMKSV